MKAPDLSDINKYCKYAKWMFNKKDLVHGTKRHVKVWEGLLLDIIAFLDI
jgi:hypothetical protein